ncbi:hypothetical protein TNCV_4311391 [Trichonephila clavipes]|nr:hypothetical protein TNCV_4311391 [Trichonephila clavipes]
MDLTSSSHLTWGRFLNRFRSLPTSLWPPPAKSSAPYACSEPWVHFRENFTKQKRNALSSFATVMPMRKWESLGRKKVKSKAVEHTRAAEAPDEKRARLQADQVRHSLAREQLKLQNNIKCDSSHNKFSRMHPEQLKHLSKGNHVSRKIRSTTKLPEQLKHLFSMWYVLLA